MNEIVTPRLKKSLADEEGDTSPRYNGSGKGMNNLKAVLLLLWASSHANLCEDAKESF